MAGSPALYGIVDLGTWTIRFSINSVQPHHARTLPCVFQDRAPIRLFKGPDIPISQEEIRQTLVVLRRFCSICKDYGVITRNVQIAANPHEAPNFDELVRAIKDELSIEVLRLSKEGEHWANAYGVASSMYRARGLYIELRPTYANVYYLSLYKTETCDETLIGPVKVYYAPSASSFRVQDGKSGPLDPGPPSEGSSSVDISKHELAGFETQLRDACSGLLEQAHKKRISSPVVFLSGSGFYGLHTLLASAARGFGIVTTGLVLKPELLINVESQTSLAKVVQIVGTSLPSATTKVIFVHHNLRNGLLFQALPPAIRYQDPMIVATRPYALPGAPQLASKLRRALPEGICPSFVRERLAFAATNSAYIHSSYNSELQSLSALLVAETGLLSGTHGITQEEKVLIGLALCQRWGGNLDPSSVCVRDKMVASLADPQLAWWARYSGLVLHLMGAAFPGAHVRDGALEFNTQLSDDQKHFTLNVTLFKDSIYSDNVIMKQRIARVQRQMKDLGGPVRLNIEYH